MPNMSDYSFAVYFWSTVAAAGITLPLAVAAVFDLTRRSGRGTTQAR